MSFHKRKIALLTGVRRAPYWLNADINISSQMTGWINKLEWQAVEAARNRVFLQPRYAIKHYKRFFMSLNIFISHNSKNKPFARRISRDLQSQGFDVWLDEWKIHGGDSISDQVQKGLEKSEVVVIILTPDSMNSEWVKDELRVSYSKRREKKGKFLLLPVLLEDCDIPPFLKDFMFIQFRDKRKYKESFSRLCDSIVFNDAFIEKYKDIYTGGFVLQDLSFEAKIEGENQEIARFHEAYDILAMRKVNRIRKRIQTDGKIVSVSFSDGHVRRETIGKNTEDWYLEFSKPVPIKGKRVFSLTYVLESEFYFSNRWFYTIDCPIRNIKFNYLFKPECLPSSFTVVEMQTLSEISRKNIKPKNLKSGQSYRFSRGFPMYKDSFEFTWS